MSFACNVALMVATWAFFLHGAAMTPLDRGMSKPRPFLGAWPPADGPYPRFEVLDEKCSILQQRIARDLPNLQDASCQRFKSDGIQKVTHGCECRVLRTEATGGTCPYDCSGSGVPSCAENAAKELGLTAITASAPLSVPKDSGSAYLEAVLCTYLKTHRELEEDKPEDLRAQSAGRLQVLDIMKKAAADGDTEAEEAVRKLSEMA
mmetsp:Transcript_94999/g.165854  ORF Transcript_94999/g.165854 Transcript_94999/m.165854 type:complete len:206 (+) Transcript_94999:109-726(+)